MDWDKSRESDNVVEDQGGGGIGGGGGFQFVSRRATASAAA